MRVTLSTPATPLGLGGVIEADVTVTVQKKIQVVTIDLLIFILF